MPANTQIFKPANDAIIADIKTELRLQGHYFTGALEASLMDKEIEEAGVIILTAEALGYLEDLEHGIPSSGINFNNIDFDKLADWVRIKSAWRGCSPKAALKIAWAIAKKWRKEGFELAGAIPYSKTGRVDSAVQETFAKNDDKYFGMIDNVAIGSLDDSFNQIKSGTI